MGNFKKLDELRVVQFIDYSIASSIESQSDKTNVVLINRDAWLILKVNIRGDASHAYDYDYEAAAAEHYMYMRFLTSFSGDPACYAAPTLYAAKKLWLQLTGRLQGEAAQSGHPVLPSNHYIVQWGKKGVSVGLAEYKLRTNNADYQLGSAIKTLAEFNKLSTE